MDPINLARDRRNADIRDRCCTLEVLHEDIARVRDWAHPKVSWRADVDGCVARCRTTAKLNRSLNDRQDDDARGLLRIATAVSRQLEVRVRRRSRIGRIVRRSASSPAQATIPASPRDGMLRGVRVGTVERDSAAQVLPRQTMHRSLLLLWGGPADTAHSGATSRAHSLGATSQQRPESPGRARRRCTRGQRRFVNSRARSIFDAQLQVSSSSAQPAAPRNSDLAIIRRTSGMAAGTYPGSGGS